MIGLRGWDSYTERLGVLLREGELVYAGQGYCVALALIGTTDAAEELCAYLERWLPEHQCPVRPALGDVGAHFSSMSEMAQRELPTTSATTGHGLHGRLPIDGNGFGSYPRSPAGDRSLILSIAADCPRHLPTPNRRSGRRRGPFG